MAVYARGYRTYSGGFRGAPAAWTIYREGYSMAFRSTGLRVIGVLFLIWFVIWGAQLYFTLGSVDAFQEAVQRAPSSLREKLTPAKLLIQTLSIFSSGVGILTALLVFLLGAGLISDDLRTRALSLYLVRPIRAHDYVLGKALIIPRILVWTCLLPGLAYYLLVGLWRPPGESVAWMRDNLDVVWMIVQHFLIAATSYTGLMLFLSSRTDRRGAVMGIAAAILFAGTMLAGVLGRLEGVGAFAKYLGLPVNTVAGIARAAVTNADTGRRHTRRILESMPEASTALWLGVALLVLGLWCAWRRARTVEVSA